MTNLKKFLRANKEERSKVIDGMISDASNNVPPIFCRTQPNYRECNGTSFDCMKCAIAWLKREAEE